MDYATLAILRNRAGDLANSGHFQTLEEIVEALRWEGHQQPERAIRGGLTRIWLRSVMHAAQARGKHFDA